MADNDVTVEENGLITVVEKGYQTSADIEQLNRQVAVAIEKIQRSNKSVLILVDMAAITGHEKASEPEALKVLKMPFDLMAMYTTSRTTRLIINTMLAFNYNRANVRVFSSVQPAKQWLFQASESKQQITSKKAPA